LSVGAYYLDAGPRTVVAIKLLRIDARHGQAHPSPGASHIALEEADAPYEAVRIDFGKAEQRQPECLAVNPKGRVPALATD